MLPHGATSGAKKCARALVKSLDADVVLEYRNEKGKDWTGKVKEALGFAVSVLSMTLSAKIPGKESRLTTSCSNIGFTVIG